MQTQTQTQAHLRAAIRNHTEISEISEHHFSDKWFVGCRKPNPVPCSQHVSEPE
jgi:hypothetical protein